MKPPEARFLTFCASAVKHGAATCRIRYLIVALLILLLIAVGFPIAQTVPSGVGTQIRPLEIVVLPSEPSPEDLIGAKKALAEGSIVEMENEKVIDFNAWLDVAVPPPRPATDRVSASKKEDQNSQGEVLPVARIVAARIAPDGSLHSYTCQTSSRPSSESSGGKDCRSGFREWVQQEQTELKTLGFSTPDQTDWTAIAQITDAWKTDAGNFFDNRVRLYRLNESDPAADWYLIARDPVSAPNFYRCGTPGTACGWYTDKRDFQISLDSTLGSIAGISLYDWSPKQSIVNGQGQFSIGFSLNGIAPSPSVGYSYTWEQADVKTTVYANAPAREASWVEEFPFFHSPSQNARTSFMSHQGVIYQVPEGTSGFGVITKSFLKWLDYRPVVYWADQVTDSPTVKVSAPAFSVDPTSVPLTRGAVARVLLTSQFPGYAQRLRWKVVSTPSWLQVSPSQGAESTVLEFRENGQAQPGLTGYVELQTDPPYAAPSVEAGPLRVSVEVLSDLPKTGVLLAGGEAWGDTTPLATAEIWYPSTGKVFRTMNTMSVQRKRHTATLLANGKILIAGGMTRQFVSLNVADLYDPTSQLFSRTGVMKNERYDHTATLLQNGKVLLVGGCCESDGFTARKSAELYDPVSGNFSSTGGMKAARLRHTATLLSNGQVLITGGAKSVSDETGIKEAEIYDPKTGQFTSTGIMRTARQGHTATLLLNGNVIVAGGTLSSSKLDWQEIYVPGDGAFARTGIIGNLAAERRYQAAVRMIGGRVLLAGGLNGPRSADFYQYNPSWLQPAKGRMEEQRGHPAAVLLVNTGTALDNRALLAGGVVENTGSTNGTLLELFDPATETFSAAGRMSTSRSFFSATAFGDVPR